MYKPESTVIRPREIKERFEAMQGSGDDRIKVLAHQNGVSEKTVRQFLQESFKEDSATVVFPEAKIEEPKLTFKEGDPVYHLVVERLEYLEQVIKKATDEYKVLAAYIKGERT